MTIHIWGAVLVIFGCGSFGFLTAASHKHEEKTLRQLLSVLDYIECELQYDLTPLPELCRRAALKTNGTLRSVFLCLASELNSQIAPDVDSCMKATLQKIKHIPTLSRIAMEQLGGALGHFGLDGQLMGLRAVRAESKRLLDIHISNQDVRLRSYQVLGLCAGAALAILFI